MTLTYSKRFYVVWNGRQSRRYHMNRATELARRMRQRGHTVTVRQLRRGET